MSTIRTKTGRQLAQHRFKILLLAIFVLGAVSPLVQDASGKTLVGDGLFIVMLLATVVAVSGHRRPFAVASISLILGVALLLLTYAITAQSLTLRECVFFTSFAFHLALLFTASIVILRDVVRAERVDAEEIAGALCVYLLIGLIFALFFVAIEHAEPGSFAFVISINDQPDTPSGLGRLPDFVYYSYVTLTTLGYGDVTPITEAARTFSWLEAVVGQFYLAVLLAQLVGLRISEARSSTTKHGS